ncbi:MAG: hypothetical protein A2162_03885 [Deltaproteobacteria bacterium RBG_13_52_11b]|nr:MAG: hypothetical protein A2162_03885 [Deltaproteobacteria bacterium RBG_13_52_11b]
MVRLRYILIALVVVGLGLLVTVYFSQSEEKRVRKQFDLLSEYVSRDPDENTIAMAHNMQKLGSLFGDSCELKIAVEFLSGTYTREEIASYAARARARFPKLSLEFLDLEITFPENGFAKVSLTARLTGRTRAGEQMRETRELECLLKKIEKKWLFNNIEVIEVLRK